MMLRIKEFLIVFFTNLLDIRSSTNFLCFLGVMFFRIIFFIGYKVYRAFRYFRIFLENEGPRWRNRFSFFVEEFLVFKILPYPFLLYYFLKISIHLFFFFIELCHLILVTLVQYIFILIPEKNKYLDLKTKFKILKSLQRVSFFVEKKYDNLLYYFLSGLYPLIVTLIIYLYFIVFFDKRIAPFLLDFVDQLTNFILDLLIVVLEFIFDDLLYYLIEAIIYIYYFLFKWPPEYCEHDLFVIHFLIRVEVIPFFLIRLNKLIRFIIWKFLFFLYILWRIYRFITLDIYKYLFKFLIVILKLCFCLFFNFFDILFILYDIFFKFIFKFSLPTIFRFLHYFLFYIASLVNFEVSPDFFLIILKFYKYSHIRLTFPVVKYMTIKFLFMTYNFFVVLLLESLNVIIYGILHPRIFFSSLHAIIICLSRVYISKEEFEKPEEFKFIEPTVKEDKAEQFWGGPWGDCYIIVLDDFTKPQEEEPKESEGSNKSEESKEPEKPKKFKFKKPGGV